MSDLLNLADRVGWQPIETAPRGTGILVIDMTAEMPEAGQAWFIHDVWSAVCPVGAIALEPEVYRAMTWPTPTHWMPLPSPPAASLRAIHARGCADGEEGK